MSAIFLKAEILKGCPVKQPSEVVEDFTGQGLHGPRPVK
jgi:hypothetical protein